MELLQIFLFPDRIGNPLHGFCVAFARLFASLLAADVLIYGALWLSGNLTMISRL